jgi:signal transduction histidine kinase
MSLRRRIFLLGAAALALPLIELLLSGLGVPLPYRIVAVLLSITAIGILASWEFNRMFTDLKAIRRAIDDTARGEFTSAIQVSRTDEAVALGEAVNVMREQLAAISRRLVEALRLESLNMLGSILVHDMKNLSFRLSSLSQNISSNYSDPAFRESLVRTLDDTTGKMDQMVGRFREQKEMIVVKIRTNLNDVVRSALANLRRDSPGIRISEQYAELPLVWADSMLVENAIFNIIENARDAMPRGGQLSVRSRRAESAEDGDDQAIIEIADTGPGMSEEFIRSELFAPFVTTKPRGLGVGLYVCQQIIRMHGGEVKVRSEPGQGTVFSIYLPSTD